MRIVKWMSFFMITLSLFLSAIYIMIIDGHVKIPLGYLKITDLSPIKIESYHRNILVISGHQPGSHAYRGSGFLECNDEVCDIKIEHLIYQNHQKSGDFIYAFRIPRECNLVKFNGVNIVKLR
jgi:hypothetical protein